MFCRGLESCPTITLMIVGLVLMVLGVLAIISGASCACSKALPAYKAQLGSTNSTEALTCSECRWLWLDCKVGGVKYECSRGCVIRDPESTETEDICLGQTGETSKLLKYNTISPIQIIGVCIGGAGILVMLLSLIIAYRMGRHYLL